MPVMPDARIPLGAVSDGGGQHSSPGFQPLQTLGALMQIKERQQQMQQQQREIDDDNAVRSALQNHPRPEDAVDFLRKSGIYGGASKLSKDLYNERTAELQADSEKLKNHGVRLDQAVKMMGGVTDNASYQLVRKNVVPLLQPMYGDAINDYLPTEYGDGTQVKAILDAGTSRSDRIQQQQQVIANTFRAYDLGLASANELAKAAPGVPVSAGAAKWSPTALEAQQAQRVALSGQLSLADNKDQYDGYVKEAYKRGFNEDVIKEFPPWNPDAKERSRLLGLTVKERVQADATADRVALAERARDLAEERERRMAAGAAAGPESRPATTAHIEGVEDKRKTDDKETEKWAAEQWEKEHPTGSRKLGPDGKPVTEYFDYSTLSDANKKEYVRRRLETEDTYRKRHDKLPSLRDAAIAAARRGDVAGFNKLREVVTKVTQGLATIDDLVKSR